MLRLDNIKAVCFDLDGTLADTALDFGFAAEAMMMELGMPFHGVEQVRDWIGDGNDRLIHRVLTRHLDGKVSEKEFNHASPIFLKAYQRRNHTATKLYEGVEACLDQLQRNKIPVGMVTNKLTAQANELLVSLGIRHYFDLILGRDAVPEGKPSPDGIFEAAILLKLHPRQILMVGDSVNDVNAARSAGSHIVCVEYGYNYGVDIAGANPDAVLESLEHLPEILKTSKSRKSRKKPPIPIGGLQSGRH